jgi:DNA replicative helicase MCM subunit Mcm2 (Cdc46/Mcm family)
MSVVDNIKLPPTLLSRFDLIYLILDKPNAESDRRLGKHLVSLYYSDDTQVEAQRQRTGNVDQVSTNSNPNSYPYFRCNPNSLSLSLALPLIYLDLTLNP